MGAFSRFDLNVKGVEGIQERTIGGGIVTLLSCVFAAFLLISEFSIWTTTSVMHRMHVDTASQDTPITIEFDISLVNAPCKEVQLDVSDNKGSKDILIRDDMQKTPAYGGDGCRFRGTTKVKKVAGEIMFVHSGTLNFFTLSEFLNFNASHTINNLRFGPDIPDMETPLIDVTKTITKNVATYKYFVNIVPSSYTYLNGRRVDTFQYSATEHEVKNTDGLSAIPGVIVSYDFSPIAVTYTEQKPSFLSFITSTSAIVGGVLAVARMVDGAIYSVSKKID